MIAENLQKIEEKIEKKCNLCGRKREEITLIAVSKTQPLEAIKDVYAAGIRDFGENKALDLKEKAETFGSPINWHMIGHLQTNKVKYVINHAEYIHSVDSIKLAEEINIRAGKVGKIQKILLEVNTSGEESKFGLNDKNDILSIANFCKDSGSLKLCGLMTMAPFTDDESVIRDCFRNTKELLNKLNREGFGLSELSMGMTNDFEIAIEEGATMLRIGTAIFGERNYLI
jgi:pyridoxal phosphate enzyme (YggS family)